MVQVATAEDLREMKEKLILLSDEITSMKGLLEKEWLTSSEAQKLSGKTRTKFYDFRMKYNIRSTGKGKGIRYKRSDIEMGMRLNGVKW